VELLRHVRDRVLSKAPAGEAITRRYYEWAPFILRSIKEDDGFKKTLKELVGSILPLFEEIAQ